MLRSLRTSSKTNGFRSGFRRFPEGFLRFPRFPATFTLRFCMHSEPKRSFRSKRSHRTADIRPGIGKCPSGSPSTARNNHMSNEARRKNRKQNLPLSESDRGRILLSIFLPSAGSSKAWGRGGGGIPWPVWLHVDQLRVGMAVGA